MFKQNTILIFLSQDPEHRGKGNTDGSPHFRCNQNDGVFVSISEILSQVSDSKDSNSSKPPSSTKPTKPFHKKLLADLPITDVPSQNARSKKQCESWIYKAISLFSAGGEGEYQEPQYTPTPLPEQSKFTVGDRIVVQNIKGKAIAGTVRWVGQFTAGKHTPPIAVGIETVSIIFFHIIVEIQWKIVYLG